MVIVLYKLYGRFPNVIMNQLDEYIMWKTYQNAVLGLIGDYKSIKNKMHSSFGIKTL